MVVPVIPGLRGSLMHRMSVDLYQYHGNIQGGCCIQCGCRAPCPTRQHAATVLAAAGDDPLQYDDYLPHMSYGPDTPSQNSARHHHGVSDHGESSGTFGYGLGGRNRLKNAAGFDYQREGE